jgi:hypothetical protein
MAKIPKNFHIEEAVWQALEKLARKKSYEENRKVTVAELIREAIERTYGKDLEY